MQKIVTASRRAGRPAVLSALAGDCSNWSWYDPQTLARWFDTRQEAFCHPLTRRKLLHDDIHYFVAVQQKSRMALRYLGNGRDFLTEKTCYHVLRAYADGRKLRPKALALAAAQGDEKACDIIHRAAESCILPEALWHAVASEQPAALDWLLATLKQSTSSWQAYGGALAQAALMGNVNTLQRLRDSMGECFRADQRIPGVLFQQPRAGSRTLLMLAAGAGHLAVVERLRQWGADPSCLTRDGRSALTFANCGRQTNARLLELLQVATPRAASQS